MLSFEKSIGAVVFRVEGGQPVFLLLHYPSGHWDFPKGHQEKGENDEETLRREVEEETGIQDLKVFPYSKKQVRYFYQAKGNEKKKRIKQGTGTKIFKRVVYYAAETKTQEVEISFEHVGYEWLSFEEALKRITFKNSKDVIKFFWPKITAELEKNKNRV